MSKASYDFGGGRYYVRVSSYDEAVEVFEFLQAQGGTFASGYDTQSLARACVRNYSYLGLDERERLCGWLAEPRTPYFTYQEFRDRFLQPIAVENIDDLI